MRKRLCLLLFSVLCCVPVLAEGVPHWLQVKTDHFTVVTDGSDRQARQTAAQLERMHTLFLKVLPSAKADAGASIIVLALKNRKDFQTLEPAAYLQKNALELAGLFMNREDRSYILLRLDSTGDHPFATVYHEYTHYMVRHVEVLPLWLNEGLAQFYQNTDLDEKTARFGQPSANEILYLRQQRLLPLATLFAVDHNSPYYHEEDKGSVFYAESWALTHLLLMQDFEDHKDRLRSYVQALTKGADAVTAAQAAFGDLRVLQKTLDSYINQGSFKLLSTPLPNAVKESELNVEPLPTPDADAFRADVMMDNGRIEEATALLQAVLKESPSNAQADESMGTLYLRKNQRPEARKWFGDAVAAGSTDYLTYFYYGSLSMELGEAGGDKAEAVSASLHKAVSLNPSFAPGYDALAHLDGMHEQLDEALVMSRHAVETDPANVFYRLNAAQIRVQRKEYPQAISILQAAQKLAKTPEEKDSVTSRLESLQRYQAQVAQAESAASSQPKRVSASEAPGEATPGGLGKPVVTDRDGRVLHATMATSAPANLPSGPPNGPKHTVKGVMRSVSCLYPKGLLLTVEGTGKTVALYSSDMYGIDVTAANFTPDPKKDLNACERFEGMEASITYAEVKDAPVAGQIVAIELSR